MARSSFSQKIGHAAAVATLVVGVQSAQAQDSDIVDIAVNNGSFNTLVAALVAADLVDVLRGDGPFTVFAPTDDAFAALPEGTVESLLLPENKELLVAILTYHVVRGACSQPTSSMRLRCPRSMETTLQWRRVTAVSRSMPPTSYLSTSKAPTA